MFTLQDRQQDLQRDVAQQNLRLADESQRAYEALRDSREKHDPTVIEFYRIDAEARREIAKILMTHEINGEPMVIPVDMEVSRGPFDVIRYRGVDIYTVESDLFVDISRRAGIFLPVADLDEAREYIDSMSAKGGQQ